MSDAAFLSLARRLGNPIADRPDAVGLLELITLTRTVRADSSWRRAQLTAVAWLRRLHAPVGVILIPN